MKKALVVEGDATTTGGRVMTASAHGMTDNGRTFALNDDDATCGNCDGVFKIRGTAVNRCYDGRPGVLDEDRVLCPCGQNRVKARADATCFVEVVGGVGADTIYPSPQQSHQQSPNSHIQRIFVWDSSTGQPLSNQSWVADVDGEEIRGLTDSAGYATIKTNGSKSFHMHVIFSSPRRKLNPDQGML